MNGISNGIAVAVEALQDDLMSSTSSGVPPWKPRGHVE
jgi:hypothetical protein